MNKNIIISLVILVVALFGLNWSIQQSKVPKNLEPFAMCLKEKQVIFYGAFWCAHCQNQKKMFGSAAASLSYVECSTPDSSGVLPVCKEAGIVSYPTWKFADGSILKGEVALATLAEKTGCVLPTE